MTDRLTQIKNVENNEHGIEDINMKDRHSFPPQRFWLSVAASESLVAAVDAAVVEAEDESVGDEDENDPVGSVAPESDYKDFHLILVNSFDEIQQTLSSS